MGLLRPRRLVTSTHAPYSQPPQIQATQSPKRTLKDRWDGLGKAGRIALIILAVFIGLAIIGALVPSNNKTTPQASAPKVVTVTETTPAAAAPAAKPTHAPKAPATVPSETSDQANARHQAESYLSFEAFSRKGLIEQLKYEGYSLADATYAVDHITVNWNEQAVQKAKDYLAMQSFSRSGLMEQLLYEGFTHAQASYGVRVAY
jgi:hypothetical protein